MAGAGRKGLNSTRQSPNVLVFKTVLESFPLTRLLSWLILVTGTFLRVDGPFRPMHHIVTVSVECLQLTRSLALTLDVMHFYRAFWQEHQSTVGALPSLLLEQPRQPEADAGIVRLPGSPILPVSSSLWIRSLSSSWEAR